jgi:hypothetical protein
MPLERGYEMVSFTSNHGLTRIGKSLVQIGKGIADAWHIESTFFILLQVKECIVDIGNVLNWQILDLDISAVSGPVGVVHNQLLSRSYTMRLIILLLSCAFD